MEIIEFFLLSKGKQRKKEDKHEKKRKETDRQTESGIK
jgi:hypothetical protein